MEINLRHSSHRGGPAEREIHAGRTEPCARDALPRPAGISRAALVRTLDREGLRREAEDLPKARLALVAELRDAIRAGRLLTPDRLAAALARALGLGPGWCGDDPAPAEP